MTDEIRSLQDQFNANPHDDEAFHALQQRYERGGDWRSIHRLYIERQGVEGTKVDFTELIGKLIEFTATLPDGEEKSQLWVALGDIYIDLVGDRDSGMKAYQTAYRIYPDDNASLERARRVYLRSGDYEYVLVIFGLELNRQREPAARAAILTRMAQIKGDYCQNLEGALTSLKEALELVPDDAFVVQLNDIYSSGETVRQRISAAVHSAEKLAEQKQEGSARLSAEQFVSAAQLEYDRENGDRELALDYARRAYEQCPGDEDVVTILSELYREMGRHEELQALEQTRLAASVSVIAPVDISEDSSASEEAVQVTDDRVAGVESDVLADQHDVESSGVIYEDSAPAAEHTSATKTLILPAVRLDEQNNIDRVATTEMAPVSEVSEVSESTKDEPLNDLDDARKILRKNPADLGALAVVRAHLRNEGNLVDLVAQLEESVRYLRKKEGEYEVMSELAHLLWHDLNDMDRAEYFFKRIKLLDSEDAGVYAFYEDFYERQGDWRKLFALLSSRQDVGSDINEQRDQVVRLAQIAEVELDSPEKAIDVWKGFLRSFDGDLQARQNLRRLYESGEKWNSLVDFFKDELRYLEGEGSATDLERVAILEEMITIYRDQMNLDTMVINVLQQILELEPGHAFAFHQLRDLLEKNRRFNDLASLLGAEAENAAERGDIGSAIELLTAVADIWQQRMNNVTQALPFLERILELDADHQATRERLREVYESRRDYRSLFDLQVGDAQFKSGDALHSHLRGLVELAQERLRDPERSVVALTLLLEHAPGDRNVINQLENVHRRQENWRALVSVLEKKAALESDDSLKVALLSEIATLYESQLEDVESATALWQEVLHLEPRDQTALEHLSSIYVRMQRYDDLDVIYRRQNLFEPLYDMLEIAASTVDDVEIRCELYRRMATVAEQDIDDIDRVIISLEALRETTADPTPIVRELIGWYRKVGELDREIEMNLVLLELSEEAEARFGVLIRLAELEVEHEQLRAALSWQLKAVGLRPEADEAVQKAEDLARSMGALADYVTEIDDLADVLDDESTQERLWQRVGRVQWHDLQDYLRAIEFFERLRSRHPQDLEFLESLEGLYDASDQPAQRIEVLRAQIEILTERGASPADLVDLLARVADVQRSDLGESDAARETYAQILDLEPDHLPSVRGMKELYRADGRWPEVVDCLLRELSLNSVGLLEERQEVEMELASVHRDELDDMAESLRYYGQVLANSPEHEGALTAVEAFLREPDLARDAALMLEPIFREFDRSLQLVGALEARLNVCTDPFEEQEILDELIPLYCDKLNDRATAFDRACRQFEIDVERDDIWLRVEQLGASLNRWEQIEELFSQHSPLAGFEGPVRYDLLRHLASIREHRLNKKDEALAAWQRLHDYDPLDQASLEALERLYRKMERYEELSEVLEKRGNLVDSDEDRVRLLLEAAQIQDVILDDIDKAIETYRNVLLIEVEQADAVDSLARLLRVNSSWIELDEHLSAQADITLDPEKRRKYLLEVAEIRLSELEDFQGAASLGQGIWENDPDEIEAISLLERVDARLAERGEMAELRLEIGQVLEPVYRQHGQHAELIGVLRVRLDFVDLPYERIELLENLAELYLSTGEGLEDGIRALSEAVVLEPENSDRRERLISLGRDAERLAEVVDALTQATLETDPLIACEIWKSIGVLERDVLGQQDKAVVAFESALDCVESDIEALRALEDLFEASENHLKLSENLRQQVNYCEPLQRSGLLRRIGALEEDVLERVVESTDAYIELLEIEPEDLGAIEALERLYERQERFFDLAELITQKVTIVSSVDAQLVALHRLADVHEHHLHNIEDAIDVYSQILALDPLNIGALDAQDRLFEAEGRFQELADVLRVKLDVLPEMSEATRDVLELRLADISLRELFLSSDAFALYRSVLGRTAGHPQAVAALESMQEDPAWTDEVARELVPYYREIEDWNALISLYEKQVEQSHEPILQAEFYAEIGRVYRDGLQDPHGALEAFAHAWKLDWEHDSYQAELIAVAANAQAWSELTEVFADVITVVSEPEHLLSLRMQLAGLYRDNLDDIVETESNLREALQIDERHEPAYSELEKILVNSGRWHDTVELLERRYVAFADEGESLDILLSLAKLQEDKLDDGFAAVETLERARVLEPEDTNVSAALNRLLRKQERWHDLSDHIESCVQWASDPDDVVGLKFELAEVLRVELLEYARSLDLYREIIEIDGEHAESIAALESVFANEPDFQVEIGGLLEHVYRRQANWPKIVEVLEVRVADLQDPLEQLPVFQEIAQIYEDALEDIPCAFASWAQAYRIEPTNNVSAAALFRIAGSLRNWQVLSDLYGEVLRENFSLSDDFRAELLAAHARVFEERLDDLAGARLGYEEVLQFEPEHGEVLNSLERVITRQQDWPGLADFYRQRVDNESDPDLARDWLERLAVLYEDVLGDIDAAIDVHTQMLEVSPSDVGTQQTLARLFSYVKRWHDLADLYRQQADYTTDPSRVLQLRFELGRLLHDELEQLDEALDIYRDILAAEPGYFNVMRALEGLRRDLAAREGDWTQLRLQVIELLLSQYDEGRHGQRMVDLMEDKVDLLSEPGEKVVALLELSELVLRVSNDGLERTQALTYMARAFCLEPSSADLVERVSALATSLNAWERLIPIYLKNIETSDDIDVQTRLLLAIAGIYEGPLEDKESAITAYQQAVELSPQNDDALTKLQSLYGELGLWRALIEVLERRLDVVEDGPSRQHLLTRVATLYDETLQQPEHAARAYRELREMDPTQLSYIVVLERLYEQAADYHALEELLREKLDMVDDPVIRRRALERLAVVQEVTLQDGERAIETYIMLLAENADDLSSIRALSRLYDASERWPELLDMLQLERDFAGSAIELNEVECRMGFVLLNQLNSGLEALPYFEAVVTRDENEIRARAGLQHLLEHEETREQAASALEQVYRKCNEWELLEELFEHQLVVEVDESRRSELFLGLSRLYEDQLEQPERSFMTLGRAFRELPASAAIRSDIERVTRTMDNYEELVAVYEDVLDTGLDDPELMRSLHWQLGVTYAEVLEEPLESIRHMERVHELDEFDLECLNALDHLYQGVREWEKLANVLEKKLLLVASNEQNNVCFQLGYLREVVFEQSVEALELYRRVILDDPAHGGALEALERLIGEKDFRDEISILLEPIYIETGAHAKLAQLYRLRLELVTDSVDRNELYKKVAEIEIVNLERPDIGYVYLSRAFREDPNDAEVQHRLELIAQSHDFYEDLVALYEEVVATLNDPVRIIELALEAARWSVNELGDLERGSSLFRRVLELEDDNELALNSLEQIARHQDNYDDLLAVLSRKSEVLFDPDKLHPVLIEAAEISSEMERFDDAIGWYKRALVLDESNIDVLQAMVGLYEITEHYEDLVEILERLTDHLYEPDIQFNLLMRIGRFSSVFLKQYERALASYQRAQEIEPDNQDVLLALEELYEASEQWERLAGIVAKQLDTAVESEEIVRLLIKQAGLKYEQFGDAQSAIEDYQRAFEYQNDHPMVVRALDKLYRAEGRSEDLLTLLNHQLSMVRETDQARRVPLLVQMADVCQAELGDDESAVAILNGVLEVEPHHTDALNILASLYISKSDWANVRNIWERQFGTAGSDSDRIAIMLKLAELLDDRLEQPAEAAAYYLEILNVEPLNEQALELLAKLYQRLNAHEHMYSLLEHRVRHTNDEDMRIMQYLEMGEFARKHLVDTQLRISALEGARSLRPDDLSIVEPLLDAYIEGNLLEQAAPILDDIIHTLTESRRLKEAVRFYHLQGKLSEQSGNGDQALQSYEAAHKIDATYIPNLLSLGRLTFHRGDFDGALKVFQTLLLHQMNIKDNVDKIDVYYYLGHVRHKLGDERRAKDMFNRALSIDPHHEPSKSALAAL